MYFRLIILLGFLLISSSSFSQKPETPNLLSYNIGVGGFGVVFRYTDTTTNLILQRKIVHALSYDYRLSSKFSIGVMASTQSIGATISDSTNSRKLESGKIIKSYIGFRGLWYYGKSPKIKMYTGFKIGAKIFHTQKVSTTFKESNLEKYYKGSSLSLGIIPFGIRFLLNKGVGLHLETSIGTPAFLFLGANYRF